MANPHRLSGNQYDVVTRPLPAEIVVEHDVTIEMRDGVRLAVSIYRPAEDGRYPVIMAASPYGKTNFGGIEIFKNVPDNHIGHIRISDSVSFEAPDPADWVPAGYVVVQIDTRGQGRSEGDTFPFGPNEASDYADCIAWAAEQPWSTGSIGLLGVSYLAITQWTVAQHRPSALKAIAPWEGFTDSYLRFYPGGIPEVGMWPFVINDWVLPNHNPAAGFVVPPEGMTPADHPLRDQFWDAARIAIENVDIPVLICASFSDQGLHSRDSFENFNLVSSRSKWLYSHRQPKWHAFYSDEAKSFQKRFFDRFLKDEANGFEETAPVRLEINSDRFSHRVVECQTWPPENVDFRPFYLRENGRLSPEHAATTSSDRYEVSGGGLSYAYTFDDAVEIVGNAKLKLWVQASSADDLDLFVGMKKIDKAGNEVFFYGFGGTNANDVIARGWLRVSHRELDEAASRPDRPVHTHRNLRKLKPGEIVPCELELLPSGTRFEAGDRLEVVIQGRAITPDASLMRFETINTGDHIVWLGGEYDSHILLPFFRA